MGRRPGSLVRCICSVCGVVEMDGGYNSSWRCSACVAFGAGIACRAVAGSYEFTVRGAMGGSIAMSLVGKAIRKGELPHPTTRPCADCGGQAQIYDHRDYNRPLDVAPVCRSCNSSRGPAIPLRGSID